jgi:hypothetical protein
MGKGIGQRLNFICHREEHSDVAIQLEGGGVLRAQGGF